MSRLVAEQTQMGVFSFLSNVRHRRFPIDSVREVNRAITTDSNMFSEQIDTLGKRQMPFQFSPFTHDVETNNRRTFLKTRLQEHVSSTQISIVCRKYATDDHGNNGLNFREFFFKCRPNAISDF